MNLFMVVSVFAWLLLTNAEKYEGDYQDFLGGHEVSEVMDEMGHHDDGTDYYAHPKYHYNYAVHDPHTGDEKHHHEERDGDTVKGAYTLKEADGTTRVVEYTADKHNGFNAIVHKLGEPNHHQEHSSDSYGDY